jgi:Ca-activated chloride channel family protein
LITDGDVCNDRTAADNLEELVGQENEAGISLSCMAVGLKDSENVELPALAQKGKGNFACIENEQAGEKILLKELSENLLCIADSVSITAAFDQTMVDSYRLIGYDNKRNLLEDTALQLEGNSISSTHSMTAIFELVPFRNDIVIDRIGKVSVNYCLPGKKIRQTVEYDCPNRFTPFEQADLQLRKDACIALFGMMLKESGYAGSTTWQDLERLVRKTFAGNNYIDKEYINLVVRAREIYEHKK